MRKPTHYLTLNADGSSHVEPLAKNTPCGDGKRRSLAEAHEEIQATLREIKAFERKAEREARFGHVRSVLVGEPGESVLDD